MRTRIAIRIHALLERAFPERRVFLRTDRNAGFMRLRPGVQFAAVAGTSLFVAWSIVATAIVLMDSIGAGNFREQAKRNQQTYETRLNELSRERDRRAREAVLAQQRFNSALDQISQMQTRLLASETRRREMETGIEVIQKTLRRTMTDRDAARARAERLEAKLENTGPGKTGLAASEGSGSDTLDFITKALAETATERDRIHADAQAALRRAEEMEHEIKLMQDQNDQIFAELEDALSISVEPLDKMFRAAGLNPDTIIERVREGYSGRGGPLMPLSFSTRGEEPSADALRANLLLKRMDRLNLYSIAARKAPFSNPVRQSFRFTSGFGPRWGRMHEGVDFAAPHGTAIHAAADGVVTHAGWRSGYGRLVKIEHEFGIETRYAHMSRLRVKKGERVSHGDRIGDMGNTGRSTGTHLHYEIRVDDKPVNPMTYIKAARDVF